MKWIKISTDLLEDENILMMEDMKQGDAFFAIWIKLLCLAGKRENNGVFEMNEALLARYLRRNKAVLKTALDTFEKAGMINREEGKIVIKKWSKYQVTRDDVTREQARLRMHKMRNNVTQDCVTESVTERNESVTVTQDVTKERKQDEERSKEEEIKKETQDSENKDASVALYKYNASSAARAPTREIVKEYINTLNTGLDADSFFDHYEAQDWTQNGERLVDWKAMARKWAASRPKRGEGSFDTDEMFRSAVERGLALVNHS